LATGSINPDASAGGQRWHDSLGGHEMIKRFYRMDNSKYAGEAQYVAGWEDVIQQVQEYNRGDQGDPHPFDEADFLAQWVLIDDLDLRDDEELLLAVVRDMHRGTYMPDEVIELITALIRN
jgi:hypothetical protein